MDALLGLGQLRAFGALQPVAFTAVDLVLTNLLVQRARADDELDGRSRDGFARPDEGHSPGSELGGNGLGMIRASQEKLDLHRR